MKYANYPELIKIFKQFSILT